MSCPLLVSDYNVPRIQWYQTDLTIIIRIQLIDICDYYLRVEDDHLLFSTIKNGKKYYLILYFFGSVIAEKTVHKNIDREIKVYLTKTLKWFPWLRLTRSDEKNHLISYDVHQIDEIQNERETFMDAEEDKKRDKYHDMNIMPFVSSSDEEDFTFNEFDFYE
ncbi:hypothetical protein HN011_002272 [Eciton burchellii]|nr:hypothetical protein HN011_002272 [Eciton burchellii]